MSERERERERGGGRERERLKGNCRNVRKNKFERDVRQGMKTFKRKKKKGNKILCQGERFFF